LEVKLFIRFEAVMEKSVAFDTYGDGIRARFCPADGAPASLNDSPDFR
jgi:hypothetical protein